MKKSVNFASQKKEKETDINPHQGQEGVSKGAEQNFIFVKGYQIEVEKEGENGTGNRGKNGSRQLAVDSFPGYLSLPVR